MVTRTLYTCNKNERAPGFTKVDILKLAKLFFEKMVLTLKRELPRNKSINVEQVVVVNKKLSH